MLRYLLPMILASMGAAAAAAPAILPPQHFVPVNWTPGTEAVAASGLRLVVETRLCGNGRPVSEACAEGDRYTAVTVAAPGMAPATILGEAGVGAFLGVGKLDAHAALPSVILVTEDGGTADCVQIDLAVPDGRAFRTVRLSPSPVEHGTICHVDPRNLAWPRDLTGHGRPEFLLIEAIFYCHFTSCAGTWYRPRVVAFDGGRGIDVSNDPALAPLYRANMQAARVQCEQRVVEAQGACAGFAADAARLGVLKEAWPVIEVQVRRGCRAATLGPCGYDEHIPADFPARLAVALNDDGFGRSD